MVRRGIKSGSKQGIVFLAVVTFGVAAVTFPRPLPAQDSIPSSASDSKMVRLLRSAFLSGGIELGRALSSTTTDTTGVVLTAGRRPATTLSGYGSVEFRKFHISGVAGASVSARNEGGFGRVSMGYDLLRDSYESTVIHISGDLTSVYSPGLSSLKSAGLNISVGDPATVQFGARVGGRWRSGQFTPVTALELGRIAAYNMSPRTTLTAHMYSAAVFTAAPAQRNLAVILDDINSTVDLRKYPSPGALLVGQAYSSLASMPVTKRKRAAVGDIGANLQISRGRWGAGVRANTRIGSSVSVWDDPVPYRLFLRQERDSRIATVGRLLWSPLPNFLVTGEFGRQLSDPIMGFSGVRYASLSARMTLEAGARRVSWIQRRQIERTARILRGIDRTTEAGQQTISGDVPAGADLLLRSVEGTHVEVAGDFSNWKPVALIRCQNSGNIKKSISSGEKMLSDWCGAFHLSAGVYKILYRVDGGEWQVPPGLSRRHDDFDGEVGVLVIY